MRCEGANSAGLWGPADPYTGAGEGGARRVLHGGSGFLGSAGGRDQVAETRLWLAKDRWGDERRWPATGGGASRSPDARAHGAGRGRRRVGSAGCVACGSHSRKRPRKPGARGLTCKTGARAPRPAASPARSAKTSARRGGARPPHTLGKRGGTRRAGPGRSGVSTSTGARGGGGRHWGRGARPGPPSTWGQRPPAHRAGPRRNPSQVARIPMPPDHRPTLGVGGW